MKDYHDKAMDEVWKIKEECWREVEHLPLDEAILERLRESNETAKDLGYTNLTYPPRARGLTKP